MAWYQIIQRTSPKGSQSRLTRSTMLRRHLLSSTSVSLALEFFRLGLLHPAYLPSSRPRPLHTSRSYQIFNHHQESRSIRAAATHYLPTTFGSSVRQKSEICSSRSCTRNGSQRRRRNHGQWEGPYSRIFCTGPIPNLP
jgi:hypothetical protein